MDLRCLGLSGWLRPARRWINFIWDEINWFVPEFWDLKFVLEFWLGIDLAPFQNSTTFHQFFYYIFFMAFVFKVVFIFQERGYVITEYRNEIKILRKRKKSHSEIP